MKYHNITHDDMCNGDGLRVVLWVSGCNHHCPGCQNPVTWDPDDGLELTMEEVGEIDNHTIGYIECMTGWCRHWARDHAERMKHEI